MQGSGRQSSEILDAIYDAGVDASRWRDVIAAFKRLFPQTAIALQVADSCPGSSPQATYLTENFEPGAPAAYAEHYLQGSPWLAAHLQAKPATVYFASEVCPSKSFVNTEFYADWIRPYHVPCGAAAIKIFEDRDRSATFCINYDERLCDRLDRQVGQSLTELLPHLQRAVVLNRRIAGIGSAPSALEAVVDALKWPALLLRRDCSIIHANGRAETAIRNARGFMPDSGRLTLQSRRENELLRRLAAAAASLDFVSLPDRMMTFSVDGEAGPNVIELTPLSQAPSLDLLRRLPHARSVLATLRYRADRWRMDRGLLARTFGFTPAECAVVAALAEGASLGDHAELTGRSIHTVRLHTKRALAKAECHSQAQLMQVLGNLQALGGGDGRPIPRQQ
jgi:DNA-binding CsgD family transcriptional regulator